jgi:chromosomal replication initiator protein
MKATETSSMKPQIVWQAALGELQLQMTKATFDTWVKQTYVVAYEDGTFVIGAQNGFAIDWLENRLHATIQRTLTKILNRSVEVRYVVQSPPNTVQEKNPEVLEQPTGMPSNPKQTNGRASCALNPDYTFEQFIIGASNRLAHAASLAVAESPARSYNPLFLYGGVGLGKTHLLHAVAHFATARGGLVLYITSETFTNDLINAIRNKSTDAFRDHYRNADVLLVDDIQFIAGKESTQEEFFHTFNALHSAGRQIIISSDRPPQSIPTLEERLASRFEWGLLADIQPPDLETRIAILRFKAEHQRARVPGEVIEFIARRMHSNIRELEGGLNRVLAYASLVRVPVTLNLAQQALDNLVLKQEELTLGQILQAVARYYKVPETDLVGRSRRKEVAQARQMAMYLAREETSASLPKIGLALGGRDHTTIMHGIDKIATLIEADDAMRRDAIAIREQLYRVPASP